MRSVDLSSNNPHKSEVRNVSNGRELNRTILMSFHNGVTHSLMHSLRGISDHSLAYCTGLTCSCGSLSTCMCNIRRQKDARRLYGKLSSFMQLRLNNLLLIYHSLTTKATSLSSVYTPENESNVELGGEPVDGQVLPV